MKKNFNVNSEGFEVTGIIDKGCDFEGKLIFEGVFRIDGSFKGEIITNDVLIVGEGALVNANIEAGTVIICGEVSGSVLAKHRVEIRRPAVFRGNISTPSLLVDEGVIFEGRSKMDSVL
jgi:cytoskeletal protein CcmA (bactofilin family)